MIICPLCPLHPMSIFFDRLSSDDFKWIESRLQMARRRCDSMVKGLRTSTRILKYHCSLRSDDPKIMLHPLASIQNTTSFSLLSPKTKSDLLESQEGRLEGRLASGSRPEVSDSDDKSLKKLLDSEQNFSFSDKIQAWMVSDTFNNPRRSADDLDSSQCPKASSRRSLRHEMFETRAGAKKMKYSTERGTLRTSYAYSDSDPNTSQHLQRRQKALG